MVNSAENRYLDARRQLYDAAHQLEVLDEQVAASGTPANRRATLADAGDPATAAAELLKQEWPDRVELFDVVTAWLEAYEESNHLWAELPPATQMRLSQPLDQ